MNVLKTLAVLLTVAAITTACVDTTGSTSGPASGPSSEAAVERNDDVAAMLPDDIAEAGVIEVAGDLTFPPMGFIDASNQPAGFDIDMQRALGGVMGVELKTNNISFDGVLGGLTAGRYDLAISGIPDLIEREKEVDFVNYITSGLATLTLADDPHGLEGNDDLCGHAVAVQRGTSGEFGAEEMTKRCSKAGEEALKVVGFPRQTDAVQALQSGRVEAVVAQSVSLLYVVSTAGGAFETVNGVQSGVSMGIAVAKDNTKLRDAVQAALIELQEQGVYGELLEKWNLSDSALEGAPINGAKS